MSPAEIGVLHPGQMGAQIGRALKEAGHRVGWASQGRSADTAERARRAGLHDVRSVRALTEQCDVLLCICPPANATTVAAEATGFRGLYIDANAVSPATTRRIQALVEAGGATYADGAIVGPPPSRFGQTRLFVSGAHAARVTAMFDGSIVQPVPMDGGVGMASALKMAYASWTKGAAALLLAVDELARAAGVETILKDEWARSLPHLPDQLVHAQQDASSKGGRWVAEMYQIAETFADYGLPAGFHEAAALIYRGTRLVSTTAVDPEHGG